MEHIRHEILKKSKALFPEIVRIRREIHMNPELSFEEHGTAALIASLLKEWGISHRTGIAGTGVVGDITGSDPDGRVVALRADMDALPISEQNDVEYRSLVPGRMHACGHDVHMAALLGAAHILHSLRGGFRGRVRLIFQPSEEKYPGGAKLMIREGVLSDPVPDAIFGQHVYPELDAGFVGMRPGNYMASTDEIYLTVKGLGGHAATPHLVVDPVLIASHIIIALQQIVSRHANPVTPTVISFGRVIANGRTNVIPDEVRIEGIMRTFDETWREEMKRKITRLATGLAGSMGGDCEVFIDPGYPVLYNNPELTKRVMDWASEYLGAGKVAALEMRTTAEDFAYYALEVPGCFFRLGTRNTEKGFTSNLHTSTFDVDESSLETGMGLMAWLAWRELMGPNA